MKRLAVFLAVAVVIVGAAAFILPSVFGPSSRLHIVSGSENRALEPIIQDWARANRTEVEITYQGSVDIARALGEGTETVYDAVWPAHSIWIELGDTDRVVKHRESILRSPVVLGIKRDIAQRLDWIGRDNITIQDIQAAAGADEFRLAMTSATQSNSGASAYFGFLYALAGDPDVLTQDHLADTTVLDGVRDLLAQIDRSSGSSGWLKDSFVGHTDSFDAMFNYEALMIEANQSLEEAGQQPLSIIYPSNGLSVADSPLGYVDKGDAGKEEAFLKLQEHLLSEDAQNELLSLGRRTGLIGLSADRADPKIWRADWGIDLERSIAPVPAPTSDVIGQALSLYQTELRKPSLTVWVLDVSGSMRGEPLSELKSAMNLLLDPEAAAVNLLQPSARDVTIILPFSNRTGQPVVFKGADPTELRKAQNMVNGLRADGGTDLYSAIVVALQQLDQYAQDDTLFDYLPAIVAMTDGASDTARRADMLQFMGQSGFGKDIPIHAIAFGKADESQLKELNDATIGRLFKAGDDLAKALRSAKGYN
ncbi:substrate-binding domain-containing protein [Actibacterium sp. 188UL27-1]|uniref:substrate-binding domain-containing protein n=1 Tax=Actibacterium sp. 188UL27-1 TaxID=2786961 RepID=UPI00195A53F7|nr:substrate-binding domain-containing protein [Actibacterium sp. 188UL27-1]MBM7069727.1 substrate-binding domain-containing protein [Actibacterium sp. 188UL27-1]